MTITIFLHWLLSTSATAGVLGALLIVALKLWHRALVQRLEQSIKHEYDLKLEQHKADLKRDYDVQIEKLKAQLQIANVRFSHIFVKQAEVIAELHSKTRPLLNAVQYYNMIVHGTDFTSPERVESAKKMDVLRNDYSEFFQKNLIYIPEETTILVNTFFNTLNRWAGKNSMLNTLSTQKVHSQHTAVIAEKIGKDIEEIENNISKIVDSLVKNFQSIIGVQK